MLVSLSEMRSSPTTRRFCISGLAALLLWLCIAVFTEILLYSQNTLYLNEKWIVSKRKFPFYMMGADDYLLGRSPLSNNQLDLSQWAGFQEVLFHEEMLPKALRFDFKLDE